MPSVADRPPAPLRLEAALATHAGRVRAENEDCGFVAVETGIFAVADGMGGHEAGELASAAIVEALATIGRAVSAADLLARLEDRMLKANAAVRELGRARGTLVGSTAAVLLVFGRDYACVWSGDSRIYRVRAGSIECLTRDHTEGRDLYDRGVLTADALRTYARRHVITRAVGVRDTPEMELVQGLALPGDVFVVCSDGLTAHLDDPEIAGFAGAPPQAACEALVALALERGGSDNVTVVVVRCEAARAEATTVLAPVPAARPADGGGLS